jgi:hypothetical protein
MLNLSGRKDGCSSSYKAHGYSGCSVKQTKLQPDTLKIKHTSIIVDGENKLCCSTHIPGTNLESSNSHAEVYGSCSATCRGAQRKSHCSCITEINRHLCLWTLQEILQAGSLLLTHLSVHSHQALESVVFIVDNMRLGIHNFNLHLVWVMTCMVILSRCFTIARIHTNSSQCGRNNHMICNLKHPDKHLSVFFNASLLPASKICTVAMNINAKWKITYISKRYAWIWLSPEMLFTR